MRRYLVPLAAIACALAAVAPASAKQSVQITIRHQSRGCHAWAVNNGPYKAAQSLHVARGTVVTIVDNDVMSHRLVEQSGPSVAFRNLSSSMPFGGMGVRGPYGPGMMGRMGAGTRFALSKPGTYRFTTKPGEDYMSGVETVGPDNVLELTVVVS